MDAEETQCESDECKIFGRVITAASIWQSTKLGTKYNFIFEIGSDDSLLHATRVFTWWSEAPHETSLRHASLILP